MGYHDEPFEGRVDSVAWGIFVQDGSSGTSTGLLAAVNQTVDWVRLPQRFPVRVRITGKPPIALRIGQTVTVAVLPKASLTPEGPIQATLSNILPFPKEGASMLGHVVANASGILPVDVFDPEGQKDESRNSITGESHGLVIPSLLEALNAKAKVSSH